MQRPEQLALRLALLAAAIVFAGILAATSSGAGGLAPALAALCAAGVAGLVVHGGVMAGFVRPLRLAAKEAGVDGANPLQALAQAAAAGQAAAVRLEALEAMTTSLRHDVRGYLSPAAMVADRLIEHPDSAVTRAGNTVLRSISRITERLDETRPREHL